MAPKTKITKEMIIDAAVGIVRKNGHESINARSVAKELGCSTQPVMYCFATMEDLRKEVYARINDLHTAYLMEIRDGEDPILSIGLNYIRFAMEEPYFFKLLFQSGAASGSGIWEAIDSPDLEPVLGAMEEAMEIGPEKTREAFLILTLFVHGYASLVASGGMEYDEKTASEYLEKTFYTAVAAAGKEI